MSQILVFCNEIARGCTCICSSLQTKNSILMKKWYFYEILQNYETHKGENNCLWVDSFGSSIFIFWFEYSLASGSN